MKEWISVMNGDDVGWEPHGLTTTDPNIFRKEIFDSKEVDTCFDR
jgi:hypothetical protein